MSSIPEKNLEQCLVRLACGLKDNGINFKSRDLMMILLGRVVYETIQGIINEDLVYKMLNELGSVKNVRKTSEKEDEEGGVDYIVTLHNEKKISIQVKPLTWVLQVIQHDGSYRSLVEKIKSFNKSNFIEEWVIIFVDKGRVCDTSIDNLYKRIYKLCVGVE